MVENSTLSVLLLQEVRPYLLERKDTVEPSLYLKQEPKKLIQDGVPESQTEALGIDNLW